MTTKAEGEGVEGVPASGSPAALPSDAVLEQQMHRFAEAEDFRSAALVRDQLSYSTVDDEATVLQLNSELYSAFSARDGERVKKLWLKERWVQCIHPDGKRSSGFGDVCDSWDRIFQEWPVTKRMQVAPQDTKLSIRGGTAIVTCQEHLSSKSPKRQLGLMIATNIFRKVDGKWWLVHRHVSPVTGSTGEGGMDPESQLWRLQQFARAAGSMPGTRIIIQASQGRNFPDGDGDSDEDEDEEDESYDNRMRAHDSSSDEEMDSDDDEVDIEEGDIYDEDAHRMEVMEAARETIRALRRLTKEGRLPTEAKNRLIREINENLGHSQVELAHELLLKGAVDEAELKDAEEEFAALVTEYVRTDGTNPSQAAPPAGSR